jgi:hypothetical protein
MKRWACQFCPAVIEAPHKELLGLTKEHLHAEHPEWIFETRARQTRILLGRQPSPQTETP